MNNEKVCNDHDAIPNLIKKSNQDDKKMEKIKKKRFK